MTSLKDPPRNILVPIDFSESSEKAASAAAALSLKTGATVHLLHTYVIPVESVGLALAVSQQYIVQFVKDSKEQLLALSARHCAGVPLGPVLVESGDPREVIIEKAKELNAELIVMGTHGRRGLSRALMGSVAESVVRTAYCSVLVVR
ncbi:MAG: universal stress protein [Vicinamibacteria bacterium]|nr:universal stress protein [Vicinamibacteria bacterium]